MADFTGSFSGSFTGSYDILTHSDEYNGTTYGYVLHQRVGSGKAEKILLSDFFRDWLGSESGSAGIQDYGAGGYIFDSDRILIRSGSYVGSTFRPIIKTATISNLFGGYSNGSLRNTFIYARGVGRNTEASPTISSSMVLTVGGKILYEDNDGVGDLHGLTLTILEATDFSKVSTTRYNTALGGATAAADSLATAIDGMGPTEIGVITSLGHWETYLSNNLRTAAKKVGLSKLGGYVSTDSGSAYAAVFYGTSGSAGVSDSLERLVAYRFTTGSNLDIPTATITTRVQSNTHGIYPFVNISDASSTNALYRYSANTASVTEPALLVNSDGEIEALGDVVTFKSNTATITLDMSSSSDTFLFVDGYVSTSGHIVPSTTELYDLGSTDLRWRDLYLSGSTIYLGSSTLSSLGGKTSGSFTGSFSGDGSNLVNVPGNSGTVTSITAGSGLNGGTITTSGTVSVDSGSMLPYYSSSTFNTVSGDATITSAGVISVVSSSYALTASHVLSAGGSDGQIQYNNGGSFGGAAQLYYDDGNDRVGIGTAVPASLLEVKYASGTGIIRINQNENAQGLYFTGRTGYDDYSIELANGTGKGPRFYNRTDGRTELQFDGTGNVGIGTTSPTKPLEVAGIIQSSGSATGAQFRMLTDTAGTSYLVFGDTADDDVGWISYNHSTNKMDFRTNAGTRMYIDSSGNVGIGTTSPDEKLTVNGSVSASLDLFIQSGSTFYLQDFSSSNGSGARSKAKQFAFGPEAISYQVGLNDGPAGNETPNWGARRVLLWAGQSEEPEAKFLMDNQGFLEWGQGSDYDQDTSLRRISGSWDNPTGGGYFGFFNPVKFSFQMPGPGSGPHGSYGTPAGVILEINTTGSNDCKLNVYNAGGYGTTHIRQYIDGPSAQGNPTLNLETSGSNKLYNTALQVSQAGTAQPTFTVNGVGTLGWGPGSSGVDSALVRWGTSLMLFQSTTLTVSGSDAKFGVGTTSPSANVHILGTTNATQIIEASANNDATLKLLETGTGDVGAAFVYDGGDNKLYIQTGNNPLSTRMTIQRDDGNVGIGTTSPNSKLDVVGTTTITGSINIHPSNGTTDSAFIQVGQGRTGDGYAYIDLVGDTTYTDHGLRIIRNNTGANASSNITHRGTGDFIITATEAAKLGLRTSNTERITILSGGNVGIGTTSPGVQLHVSGGVNPLRLEGGEANDHVYMEYYVTGRGGRSAYVGFPSVGNIDFTIGNEETGGDIILLPTSTGNVGIGNDSPAQKLHINGSARADGNTAGFIANSTAGTDATTLTWLSFQRNSVEKGWVGYGDGSDGLFRVRNGIGNLRVDASSEVQLWTNSGQRLTVDTSGNVGIGTTDPGSRLHVDSGDVLVTGGGIAIGTGSFPPELTGNDILINGGVIATSVLPGNIDHFWHDDSNNRWNFVSDGSRTAVGNSTIRAGEYDFGTDDVQLQRNTTYLRIVSGSTGNYLDIGRGNDSWAHFYANPTQGFYFNGGSHGIVSANGRFGSYTNTDLALSAPYGTTRMTIEYDTGNVGINNTAPDVKLSVVGTSGLPASSGTTPNGVVRIKGGTNSALFIGNDGSSPYGAWLQVQDITGLGTEYPLLLNPNGGNVGIGTASPQNKLHVAGVTTISDSSNPILYFRDGSNVIEGGVGFASVTDGLLRFAVGSSGLSSDTKMVVKSDGNVGIGTASPGSRLEVTNAVSSVGSYLRINNTIGKNWELMAAIAGVSNDGFGIYSVTDSAYRFVISSAGNVGIGNDSPGYKLDVTGTIRATDDVIVTSDMRLKNELPDTVQGLEAVDKIRPIKYTLKSDENENPKTHLGFSAQELLDIVPEVVNSDDEGYYSVSYQKLVPVLVKAIQELTEEVRELKKKIGE